MKPTTPSKSDLLLAGVCRKCPVCRRARQQSSGLAHWLVRRVEAKVCPFCRAYARVYGRPSSDPLPSAERVD